MLKVINFDMDGTLFDLYGVENWLPKLRAGDASPYRDASPMVNFSELEIVLAKLQARGWKINIVSWLAKGSDSDYDAKVTQAKIDSIRNHFPHFWFNNVHIVPYGTPKYEIEQGVLFDDEIQNRIDWMNNNQQNVAYNVWNILNICKNFLNRG